ncbi:MAG: TusE/DsrC/DsvC family sulfur relay protein [candidate division Zixibacteria bacterium]|nr:TusE/DsrC/DsvC family sulfur relay protein [candidate division Zixibacteria bacterium]
MSQQSIEFNGITYTLDRHGFLDPSDQWSISFAKGMAEKLGILEGLSKEHWDFINYLRSKFLDENTVPVVVKACSDNNIRLTKLRALFPTGYHRGACKIAGLNFNYMCETNLWLSYETHHNKDTEYKTNELGFLEDFELWNERFAYFVVQNWGLPDSLTDQHWKVIKYLRDFYSASKNIPSIYEVCKANDIGFDELDKLFPRGYRRGACRVSGLPFFA